MHALVTGASGFVGGHLVDRLLLCGWQVTALARGNQSQPNHLSHRGCQLIFADIMDVDVLTSIIAAENFDVVFHLAGRNAFAQRRELYGVNVLGSVSLFEAVRASRRPELKVILMGSSAEYGASKDDPIREDSPLLPVSDYGVTKVCMDLMGVAMFKNSNQNVVCARPFNIVGPGQRGPFLQATVVNQIVEIETGRRASVLELGDLEAHRDFIDVRDVASGLVALAKNGRPGEAYNLCSGRAVQVKSLADYVVSLTTSPITIASRDRTGTGGNVPYQRGSCEKTYLATGWLPLTPLEVSLADALNYSRAQRDVLYHADQRCSESASS